MILNKRQVKQIIEERLGVWGRRLAEETATPVFLVGVCNDRKNLGRPVLCALEDMDNELLASFLIAAVKGLLDSQPPTERGRWESK